MRVILVFMNLYMYQPTSAGKKPFASDIATFPREDSNPHSLFYLRLHYWGYWKWVMYQFINEALGSPTFEPGYYSPVS
jgi:hypothetical protein